MCTTYINIWVYIYTYINEMAYHLIATNILKKENQRILDVIISLFLTCL